MDKAAWERQKGDTDVSYAAFCVYRDMGAKRSLQKAADAYYGKTTVNLRYFEAWSSDNDWVARCEAYDAHMDTKRRERLEAAQTEVIDYALSDYYFLRKVIEKRVTTFESANYIGDLDALRFLQDLMRKNDDMGRRAVGLPDRVNENRNEHVVKTWEDFVAETDYDDSDPYA